MARNPLIEALNEFRLSRDWTWTRLTREMNGAGFTIAQRTLHYLIKEAPDNCLPRDRTLYKIQHFLEYAERTFPPPHQRSDAA